MEKNICPKCGSQDLIPEARVFCYATMATGDLAVYVEGKYVGENDVLRARICGSCGHTELFVENPQKLLENYKSSQTK